MQVPVEPRDVGYPGLELKAVVSHLVRMLEPELRSSTGEQLVLLTAELSLRP